jgi:calcium-dependent protein kinase
MGCLTVKKNHADEVIRPIAAQPKQKLKREWANSSLFAANYEIIAVEKHSPGLIAKRCRHKTTGITYIAKLITKKALTGFQIAPAALQRELAALKALNHPNLAQIAEIYEDPHQFIIVQNSYQGGPILEQITAIRDYSEGKVASLVKQLISAVTYCHQHRVMHRDLSPDTVILDPSATPLSLKITDFGVLSFIDVHKSLSGRFGTVYYCAPEVFSGVYDERCDLWSCGVIMHVLLMGYPPFQGLSDRETQVLIEEEIINFHDSKYGNVSESAKNLLHRLLIKAPSHRITGEETIAHQWFRELIAGPGAALDAEVVQRMMRFKGECQLKDALFTFICNNMLTEEDIKTLREAFIALDKNGDGKLSREEVIAGMQGSAPFGVSDLSINTLFDNIDRDHSGYIDYSEFLRSALAAEKLTRKDVLRNAFKMIDKDGNGFISMQEIACLLDENSQNWGEIIREADKNGDGLIDMMEFEALLQQRV